MITSSTWSAPRPACASAPRIAAVPRAGVGTPVNWPRKEPMAVRLAPTMTTSLMWGSGIAWVRLGRVAGSIFRLWREITVHAAAQHGSARSASSRCRMRRHGIQQSCSRMRAAAGRWRDAGRPHDSGSNDVPRHAPASRKRTLRPRRPLAMRRPLTEREAGTRAAAFTPARRLVAMHLPPLCGTSRIRLPPRSRLLARRLVHRA